VQIGKMTFFPSWANAIAAFTASVVVPTLPLTLQKPMTHPLCSGAAAAYLWDRRVKALIRAISSAGKTGLRT